MTRLLDSTSADFETHFEQLLGDKREQSADVNDAVAAILADVRAAG
jgi:histidinol dehydrogenase